MLGRTGWANRSQLALRMKERWPSGIPKMNYNCPGAVYLWSTEVQDHSGNISSDLLIGGFFSDRSRLLFALTTEYFVVR